MQETHVTLIERLAHGRDEESWRTFVEAYWPLLVRYARRRGAREDEAEDVAQNVLRVVADRIGSFEHAGRTGSFRAWLHRITTRKVAQLLLDKEKEPDAVGGTVGLRMIAAVSTADEKSDKVWEDTWRKRVLEVAMERARAEVQPATWRAFELCALEGVAPAEAAAELGMPMGKVYVYKSRVAHRIRRIAERMHEEIETHG